MAVSIMKTNFFHPHPGPLPSKGEGTIKEVTLLTYDGYPLEMRKNLNKNGGVLSNAAIFIIFG
jgi:hypothetical protein